LGRRRGCRARGSHIRHAGRCQKRVASRWGHHRHIGIVNQPHHPKPVSVGGVQARSDSSAMRSRRAPARNLANRPYHALNTGKLADMKCTGEPVPFSCPHSVGNLSDCERAGHEPPLQEIAHEATPKTTRWERALRSTTLDPRRTNGAHEREAITRGLGKHTPGSVACRNFGEDEPRTALRS
jgi:hypothetical protein